MRLTSSLGWANGSFLQIMLNNPTKMPNGQGMATSETTKVATQTCHSAKPNHRINLFFTTWPNKVWFSMVVSIRTCIHTRCTTTPSFLTNKQIPLCMLLPVCPFSPLSNKSGLLTRSWGNNSNKATKSSKQPRNKIRRIVSPVSCD